MLMFVVLLFAMLMFVVLLFAMLMFVRYYVRKGSITYM